MSPIWSGSCALVRANALVVVDGYHAFAALPVDLAAIGERAFFVAGGYKYAMAGEGACFLAVPPGTELRPLATGWFADFEGLGDAQAGPVGYGDGGMRFFGATFDPSGLYRFNAVMRWLAGLGVDFSAVHAHVERLQRRFLDALAAISDPGVAARSAGPAGRRAAREFSDFRTALGDAGGSRTDRASHLRRPPRVIACASASASTTTTTSSIGWWNACAQR